MLKHNLPSKHLKCPLPVTKNAKCHYLAVQPKLLVTISQCPIVFVLFLALSLQSILDPVSTSPLCRCDTPNWQTRPHTNYSIWTRHLL